MKDKRAANLDEAVSRLRDDAVVLIGGFGVGGVPEQLIEGICGRGLRNLTIVANNSGTGHTGIARLLEEGCIGKIICSFPFAKESHVFKETYAAGKVDLEVVPQGTLAERMRNAGAGLGGFLTPTGVGTEIAEGKQEFDIEGKRYILEKPLRGDFALVKAYKTDPRGNLVYRKAARNFNPVMAMAADYTIAEVAEEVPMEQLDPETIVTPGVYVDCYYVNGG